MKPRQKQTMRVAALDSVLKCARGITGCFASFHCDRIKNTNRMMPGTMRQRTVAELQGKLTPPKPRPRRNSRVVVVTVGAPSQSMAFKPATKGVFGVWTSRKTNRMMKAIPSQGTTSTISQYVIDISNNSRFKQKHHRQLTLSLDGHAIAAAGVGVRIVDALGEEAVGTGFVFGKVLEIWAVGVVVL